MLLFSLGANADGSHGIGTAIGRGVLVSINHTATGVAKTVCSVAIANWVTSALPAFNASMWGVCGLSVILALATSSANQIVSDHFERSMTEPSIEWVPGLGEIYSPYSSDVDTFTAKLVNTKSVFDVFSNSDDDDDDDVTY